MFDSIIKKAYSAAIKRKNIVYNIIQTDGNIVLIVFEPFSTFFDLLNIQFHYLKLHFIVLLGIKQKFNALIKNQKTI